MSKLPVKPRKGRRQPPRANQFKPGQSGNPGGRPKGSRNKVTRGGFARIVLEEAERQSSGGVTVHRAVIRKLYDQAAAGHLSAAALVLPLASDAEAVVTDLEVAEDARAAEVAIDERKRAEAAEDEALKARLAADNRELFRYVKDMARDNRYQTWRYTDLVDHATMQRYLGHSPGTVVDGHELAALYKERVQKMQAISERLQQEQGQDPEK